MPVLERSTLIRAPLDEVWRFHATVDGLVAVTPGWLDLRVEAGVGPHGERSPDTFEPGSEVTLSLAPLGLGPRASWTSRITHRERSEGQAEFRDELVDGPFRRWHHTHRFAAVDGGTRVTDRVEYRLRRGPTERLEGLAGPALAVVLGLRHRATRRQLE